MEKLCSSTSLSPQSPRAARITTLCGFLGLVAAQSLTGCGGTGNPQAQTPPPTGSASAEPPMTPDTTDGWFVGTVTIDGTDRYGDAVVSADGAMRLYVGDPYVAGGALQETRAKSSEQFVGRLDLLGTAASGSGVVIGQQCASTDPTPFCAASATTEVHYAVTAGQLGGELQVNAGGTSSSWALHLSSWPHDISGPPASLAGQYQEQVAEFAHGDTVINFDDNGTFFFQSVHSGCVGNGTWAPHPGGPFDVFDVSLTIENCSAPYSYLNGQLDGLATTSSSSVWDYDTVLIMWVSSSSGSAKPVGIRFLAYAM